MSDVSGLHRLGAWPAVQDRRHARRVALLFYLRGATGRPASDWFPRGLNQSPVFSRRFAAKAVLYLVRLLCLLGSIVTRTFFAFSLLAVSLPLVAAWMPPDAFLVILANASLSSQVQLEVSTRFVQDQLKGDNLTEMRVKFIRKLEHALPAGED